MRTFPFKVVAPATVPDANFTVRLQIEVPNPKDDAAAVMAFIHSPLLLQAFSDEWLMKNAPGHGMAPINGTTPLYNGGEREKGLRGYEIEVRLTRKIQ